MSNTVGVGLPVNGHAGVSVVRFGPRLRQLRHARGKSLAVIAGLAGISQSYLSLVELGVRPVHRLPVIARLAWALEVPPKELLLAALDDYLAHGEWAHGEDVRPAEGTAWTRAGRCRGLPGVVPGAFGQHTADGPRTGLDTRPS
jgi:transcriptional regulator with XRE-family HTH domain